MRTPTTAIFSTPPGYQCNNRHYDPTVTRTADGQHILDWPIDTPDTCVVSRNLLIEMVAERNKLWLRSR